MLDEPGLPLGVFKAKGFSSLANDTWPSEAVGKGFGGENTQPFECHIKMLTRSGIWNLENMDLSQLVADKAYEFLFAWSPLKIKGGTGSPGNPVAMY